MNLSNTSKISNVVLKAYLDWLFDDLQIDTMFYNKLLIGVFSNYDKRYGKKHKGHMDAGYFPYLMIRCYGAENFSYNTMNTLAHEMRHAKQASERQLVCDSKNEVFHWDGIAHKTFNEMVVLSRDEYLALPWEIDARKYAKWAPLRFLWHVFTKGTKK